MLMRTIGSVRDNLRPVDRQIRLHKVRSWPRGIERGTDVAKRCSQEIISKRSSATVPKPTQVGEMSILRRAR